jgi:hypothetical protein
MATIRNLARFRTKSQITKCWTEAPVGPIRTLEAVLAGARSTWSTMKSWVWQVTVATVFKIVLGLHFLVRFLGADRGDDSLFAHLTGE